jgi:cytochrome c biogenesis protein CcdA
MDDLALALAAGLVAAFNPCGFALLPSYLALLVADPIVGAATEFQGALSERLEAIGVWWVAVACAALTAGALLAGRTARHRKATRTGSSAS